MVNSVLTRRVGRELRRSFGFSGIVHGIPSHKESGTAPAEEFFAAVDAGHNVSPSMREEMELRERAKNTLGNLTLLTPPANTVNGNEGWDYKRERIGKSLLALNRDIANHPYWSEQEIRERGEKLAQSAHLVWPGLTAVQH